MRLIARSLFTLAAAAASSAGASAGEIEAASKIDSVTVYPDAAIVTRVAEVDLSQGDNVVVFKDLPLALDPASLRVEGVAGAALTIGAVETRVAPADAKAPDDALAAKIASLRDEREGLQTTIDALQAKRAMILRFSQSAPEKISSDAKPLDVGAWPAAWDAVEAALAKVGADLRPALDKARALDEEIKALEAQRQSPGSQAAKQTASVTLAAAQGAHASLTLSYRVPGVGWVPAYDAALNTADGADTLTLTRRAGISQTTGEDWSDVALTVSTARVARSVAVADVQSETIDFWQPEVGNAASRMAPMSEMKAAPPRGEVAAVDQSSAESPAPIVAQQATAQLQANAYSAQFRAPGRITLASDGAQKSFVLDRFVAQPTLTVKTAPGVDPTAYIQAHFIDAEDAPILAGEVALLRDGAYLGQSRLGFVAPGDGVDLGFGGDDKIKVQRAPVNRKENDPTWYNQTKVETREFATTVKNLHAFPIKVEVVDQMPVSENTAISVDLSPATTPPTEKQVGDKRGVMSWTLDLKPGESKDIHLAYRLKWPADRAIMIDGAPLTTDAR
ncbi:MAG: mucoidy inhibitor MuiA family protein [Roseiarcus sp.]